jgi:hypothetical protein
VSRSSDFLVVLNINVAARGRGNKTNLAKRSGK